MKVICPLAGSDSAAPRAHPARWLRIQELEDALHPADGGAELAVQPGQPAQAGGDGDAVHQEAGDHRQRQPPGDHFAPAVPHDRGNGAQSPGTSSPRQTASCRRPSAARPGRSSPWRRRSAGFRSLRAQSSSPRGCPAGLLRPRRSKSASWSWICVLPFWMRLPKKNATRISTGTSARMNRVRLAFRVSTMTIEPIRVTIWLSSMVRLLVSMVRIWVTSLDRRETRSPTRRAA